MGQTILVKEGEIIFPLLKLFLLAGGSFILAILITPIFTHFAYKNEWWRKVRSKTVDGKPAPVFHKLHSEKHKRLIPTMAGTIILTTVALITILFNLDRSQTWLPLFSLLLVGSLGLIDDYIHVKGLADRSGGLSAKVQFFWIISIALIGAWWFYFKLGWDIIHIPAYGNLTIGWLYIPLFILVFFATSKSVGITDGLDGLSGGLLSASFASFGVIAFFEGNFGIAAFCATIMGAVLAYTWFNIYPARFFMGNSGSISLGATLGVIAMLTNSVFVLPIIGFIFFAESGSSTIQLLSKKIRGKKVFLSAPIHHHFEAIGWPETKVTMRFWIIGFVMAIIGLVIGLLGRG